MTTRRLRFTLALVIVATFATCSSVAVAARLCPAELLEALEPASCPTPASTAQGPDGGRIIFCTELFDGGLILSSGEQRSSGVRVTIAALGLRFTYRTGSGARAVE
ncbi:MAG: hypothetical protein KJO31_18155 [Gammaproteobacteria bacterium]|nr:hypothetical protein [Gammaproteobacteria bacterium]